jgi:hypothetical protein
MRLLLWALAGLLLLLLLWPKPASTPRVLDTGDPATVMCASPPLAGPPGVPTCPKGVRMIERLPD